MTKAKTTTVRLTTDQLDWLRGSLEIDLECLDPKDHASLIAELEALLTNLGGPLPKDKEGR